MQALSDFIKRVCCYILDKDTILRPFYEMMGNRISVNIDFTIRIFNIIYLPMWDQRIITCSGSLGFIFFKTSFFYSREIFKTIYFQLLRKVYICLHVL